MVDEVKCVNIEDWGECTFEKESRNPDDVNNDCKDVLNKLALRLQQNANDELTVIGYADERGRRTHVEIVGSYVRDTNHTQWMEIHPVTSIKVVAP